MPSSYANLKNISEKFYKHKKNGVEIILRETITNSIHACIIKKEKLENSSNYTPKINIYIHSNNPCIVVKDNGCGFSKEDKEAFLEIAQTNMSKRHYQLPSKGLGRLAIVHFATKSIFETISDSLSPRKLIFDYPEKENRLPFFEEIKEETQEESGTKIKMKISEELFKTFNKKYSEISKLEAWIAENFVYLLYGLNNLEMFLKLDDKEIQIKFKNIESDSFLIKYEEKEYSCHVLMVDSEKTSLILVAHRMPVENDKIEYDRQFKSKNKKIYIASDLFDEYISPDGLEVKIPEEISENLQTQIADFLDNKFSDLIEELKKINLKTLYKAQNEYPYLTDFMPTPIEITGHRLEKKEFFINEAINQKGEAEKNFWKNEDKKTMDPRLGKSALYLYVKHRQNVLSLVENALGDSSISENDFHQLLTDRGCADLAQANHNLWLIDDKFSYFMEGYNSKNGESVADIEFYSYMDSDAFPQNIILIELKKPTKAHNAGEMIEQIREYASKIYKKGKTRKGINFDAKKCKFYGYIIANIADIKKEIESHYFDTFIPIAFAIEGYEGKLRISSKEENVYIYITLLSTQDLLKIAKDRNKVLFNLLKIPSP